ncbi:MAG: sulfotransferase domain-containing protein [Proteobacteria bacterium]|nr:sulfotransferase domain-containing protein [Pseudomonadota bacterium]
MDTAPTTRPEIRQIYQNHHLDSTRWDYFDHRPGDIVISTSYKAGTTWTQTIVGNLLYPNDDLPMPATHLSPWLDFRVFPLENVLNQLKAQDTRRFVKTHLPLDGLPYWDNVKYLVIARDARDVFMSLLNHWGNHTPQMFMNMNNLPGLVGDPFPPIDDDPKITWRNWITKGGFEWETDGYPMWSHLSHAATWWEFRHLPNIKLIHYSDLLADLEGQMRDIADYLEIEVPEDRWPHVVDACTFATVKKDPEKVVGNMDFGFKGGAQTFINKGTNGRWKGVLDDDDLALYEAAKARAMPPDCSEWLENGWGV